MMGGTAGLFAALVGDYPVVLPPVAASLHERGLIVPHARVTGGDVPHRAPTRRRGRRRTYAHARNKSSKPDLAVWGIAGIAIVVGNPPPSAHGVRSIKTVVYLLFSGTHRLTLLVHKTSGAAATWRGTGAGGWARAWAGAGAADVGLEPGPGVAYTHLPASNKINRVVFS